MKRYLKIIIGSILIGLSFNIFFIPYDLVPNGLLGLGVLFSKTYNTNAAIFIAITNIVLLLITLPVLGIKDTYKYLITSLMIPLVIYASRNIDNLIYFENMETIIIAIAGALLTGLGYSIVNKEGASCGGFEIIQDIFNKAKIYQNRFISTLIEFIVVILTLIAIGFEAAIYSAIIILIVIYMSTKAKLGISSNKTFLIITAKEKEVKDYLLNDLKYDFTEFNAKGGFTNHKSKIIMSVIDTKDYYKLKEGINIIDPKAFISIIDNYESINKNITINKQKNSNFTL